TDRKGGARRTRAVRCGRARNGRSRPGKPRGGGGAASRGFKGGVATLGAMLDPRRPPRLLLVRLSALGDCVHVLPALDALRTAFGPRAHIAWLVEEKAAALL